MEDIDGEWLPWVEAHTNQPRKEHLVIQCEICYACS